MIEMAPIDIESIMHSSAFIVGYLAGLITIISYFKAKLKYSNAISIYLIKRKIKKCIGPDNTEKLDNPESVINKLTVFFADLEKLTKTDLESKDYNSVIQLLNGIIMWELDYYYTLSENTSDSETQKLEEYREKIDDLYLQLYDLKLNSLNSKEIHSAILGLIQMAKQRTYNDEAFDLLVTRVGSIPDLDFKIKVTLLERIKRLCNELYVTRA
jgi:hypothetical protein